MPKMRTQFGVLFLLTLWGVHSDAWFWSWTGTTTVPPTVEHEGSGSPAGSEELLTENIARVGAEIIDEGHGIHKAAQTWDETTEGPRLTTLIPTTQPETELTTEKGTEEISSRILKPGNGTSSLEGMGSGGSDHLWVTGNVSELGSGLESELASGTGSGLWSETSRGSGFETQRAALPTDHRELDSGGSILSQNESRMTFQKSDWIIPNKTDEGHNIGSTQSAANPDFSVETPSNTGGNRKLNSSSNWNANDFNLTMYSHENSTLGDLLKPIIGNNPLETLQVPKDNQLVEVTQLPAGEPAANQEVLQTSRASFDSQTLYSTTQTANNTHKMLITQPQIASKKPDTTLISKATQHQVPKVLAASQTVATSQIGHIMGATQTPVTDQERNQATLTSLTSQDSQAPAESHTDTVKSPLGVESPQCLLLDTGLPFCSSMVGERFAVPNYLNQSSVEEVQVLFNEWAWLLRSHCHHSLEWFFCLLLVPKCGSPVPPLLPCRSFCEVLRDSCWTLLDEGRLPVECHTLPDEEDHGGEVYHSKHRVRPLTIFLQTKGRDYCPCQQASRDVLNGDGA
ncbi:hypothetical protein PAMP_004108 [Pampus punctatissimus]